MITKSHFILSISIENLSAVSGGQGGNVNMPLSGPTHVAPVTNWAMGGTAIGTQINQQIMPGTSRLPGETMAQWRRRNPHLAPYQNRPIRR